MLLRALTIAACLPLCVLTGPARAQEVVNGQTFGAWTVACEALGMNRTACVLTQRLTRESDNAFIAQMMLFWDGPGTTAYLTARVPEGVYLPSGFAIRGETAEDAIPLVWQSCSAGLCEALHEVGPEVVDSLAQEEAVLGSFQPRLDMDVLVFRFSMAGAAEGLKALRPAQ